MNPYTPIDEAYHREVEVATERHEKDAAPLNARLVKNLAKCKTQDERDEVMAEFSLYVITPVQDAYNAAVEKARLKMEAAKRKVAPQHEKFVKAENAAREKKTARHRDLRDKLLAGEASQVEIQEALGLTLETMVGESTTEGN